MSKTRHSVLLIDSKNESRKLIKSTLHAIGHKNIKVVDGPVEALEELKYLEKEYGLIITTLDSEDSETLNFANELPLYLQVKSIFIYSDSEASSVREFRNLCPGIKTLKRPFAKQELDDLIIKVEETKILTRKSEILFKPLHEDSRILVIDDFETMRQLMRNAFIDIGYFNIDNAKDGVDAYEKIRKAYYENDPYQLVFADWNMPERTGYELLVMLQKDILLKPTPFIMVTAENQKDQVMNAISAGVDDYIVKPLNPKTLQAKLDKINTNIQRRLDIKAA